MIEILSWAFFGLLVGALAKLIMPGKDPGGCLVTILIGIAGALLGGLLAFAVGLRDRPFDLDSASSFHLPSLGLAILGALILLAIYRLIFRRRGWGEGSYGDAGADRDGPEEAGGAAADRDEPEETGGAR